MPIPTTAKGTVQRFGVAAAVLAIAGLSVAPVTARAAVPAAHPLREGATATASASAWTFLRHTCRTTTAGTACVSLLGNGRPGQYLVRYAVMAARGQWIRPLATTIWWPEYTEFAGDPEERTLENVIRSNGYVPFCRGGCAPVRGTAQWERSSSILGVYTLLYDTSQGRYEVNAGLTSSVPGPRGVNDLGQVSIRIGLSSTAANTVMFTRSVVSDAPAIRQVQLYESRRALYRRIYCSAQCATYADRHYVSPTYLRPWTRSRYPTGGWLVTGDRLAARVDFFSRGIRQLGPDGPRVVRTGDHLPLT